MNKFSVLFSQSYFNKIKAKSFIISTVIMLAGMAVLFMWPTISGWFASEDDPRSIAVVDQTGREAAALLTSDQNLKFIPFKGNPDQADDQVIDGARDGALILSVNSDDQLTAEIHTAKPLTLNNQQVLEQHLQATGQLFAIQQLNLTGEQAQRILSANVPLDQKAIGGQSQNENKTSESKTTATTISYGIAFYIYLFVLSYLSMISSEIAAEKDSRIMEMIISSASPTVHLLSRVSGILALAFTQTALLVSAALLMAYFFNDGAYWQALGSILSSVSISYLIFALLFFLLACVLYTLIGAVLGSLVNKVQDVGQSMSPVIFVLMIGFFIAISGMGNPDSLLIQIFSYIPFTASMIMPMRIGATDMGIWQAVLSLIILIATIIGLFLFSLKFYRGSVLTYMSGSFIKKMKQAMSLSK